MRPVSMRCESVRCKVMFKWQDLEVPEEVFNNSLIGFHLKCMRAFGYIISRRQRNKSFHLFKGAIFIGSFALFSSLIFIKISKGFGSSAYDATTCATGIAYLSTSIATANAFFQRKRVVRMVKFLHEDITELFRSTDTGEEIMLKETIRYIRNITSAMWGPTLIAAVLISVDCFYRTAFKPETIFNTEQVLNGTAQPILLFNLFPFGEVCDNFAVAYLGPFLAMILGVATIPCWHTFVTCLMKYIVFKYTIIHKRIKEYDFAKLSVYLDHELKSPVTDKDLQYWHTSMCRYFVREQNNLRWFTKELESLIRIPVFLDFLIFSILLCFLFYAITAGNASKRDYFFFAIFLFVITFLLWLYHWHATQVTSSNEVLCFALYCSPWYTFPINIQKNILLMMVEANKPLIINAIFVELNLKTFVDVVRGAYSYFNLLRNAGFE